MLRATQILNILNQLCDPILFRVDGSEKKFSKMHLRKSFPDEIFKGDRNTLFVLSVETEVLSKPDYIPKTYLEVVSRNAILRYSERTVSIGSTMDGFD